MNIKDVIIAAGDRTTGNYASTDQCFGDGDLSEVAFVNTSNKPYAHAVYSIATRDVFLIVAEVPDQPQAFRWINPAYKEAYYNECIQNGTDPDIAFDDVNFTHIDTEELMLEYLKDIGEGYYDNLPIVNNIPTLTEEANPFIMPMPGTLGGAKFKFGDGFQNEPKTNGYKVKLNIQFDFDVEATSMDQAVEKAREWWNTSKVKHGQGDNVYWEDSEIVEEHASRIANQD